MRGQTNKVKMTEEMNETGNSESSWSGRNLADIKILGCEV